MFGFYSFYSILVLVLTLVYVPVYTQNNTRLKDNFFYFVCFILLLFSMCRGESVGGDLEEYIPLFQRSDSYQNLSDVFKTTVVSGYETGFILLCKFLSLVSFDSRWFIAVTAVLSLIGPFYLIKKYSNNKGLSLLLYVLLGFYNVSFNNVRQAIAVSIIMIAICYLLKKKNWAFWIGVLLATSIHTSAVFAVLFYPLVRFKYSPQRVVVGVVVIVGIFYLFSSFIFNYLISNIFTRYLEETGDTYTTGGGYGLLIIYIIVATFCVFLFNQKRKKMSKNEYFVDKFFLLSFMIVIVIQSFALYMAAIARLGSYFYLPLIVLLPNLLERIKNISYRRCIKSGVFVFYYVLACYTLLSPTENTNMNPTDTIPYVFLDRLFLW